MLNCSAKLILLLLKLHTKVFLIFENMVQMSRLAGRKDPGAKLSLTGDSAFYLQCPKNSSKCEEGAKSQW